MTTLKFTKKRFIAGAAIVVPIVLIFIVLSRNTGGVNQVAESGVDEPETNATTDTKVTTLLALESKIDNQAKVLEVYRQENKDLNKVLKQRDAELGSVESRLEAAEKKLQQVEKESLDRFFSGGSGQRRVGEAGKANGNVSLFAKESELKALVGGSDDSNVVTDYKKEPEKQNAKERGSFFSRRSAGFSGEKKEGDSWVLPSNRPELADKTLQAQLKRESNTKNKDVEKIKRYTITPNTIGLKGTAVSALVGRIPIDGTTPDPYRATIAVGKENFAGMGHYLEDIEGMMFSGWASGDWNLRCVNLNIDSYTFVFKDGTVVTKEPENSAGRGAATTERIGTIAMPNGFPCVPGSFHTNAPSYLAQKTFLRGLSLGGAAYAAAQTTQDSLPLGGGRTTVDGENSKYVWGKVVEGSVEDSVDWIEKRAQNSFDAVVTAPGAEVIIHFERIIEIDYDPEGRKIDYAKADSYVIDSD